MNKKQQHIKNMKNGYRSCGCSFFFESTHVNVIVTTSSIRKMKIDFNWNNGVLFLPISQTMNQPWIAMISCIWKKKRKESIDWTKIWQYFYFLFFFYLPKTIGILVPKIISNSLSDAACYCKIHYIIRLF